MSSYRALKSGTDLRGTAMGEKPLLSVQAAEAVGCAFAHWCLQLTPKATDRKAGYTIAIGRDSRLTGEALLAACARGIAQQGIQVLDFGLCTTPAMYKAISGDQPVAQASIMVTASHHPPDRNGFKFFHAGGGITGEMLDQILALMEVELAPAEQRGHIKPHDYLSTYQQQLVSLVQEKLEDPVRRPLLGLHVVVDAGNGAGGFYAKLLESMGAWTEGSQFLEPDGRFPNHSPNPEDKKAMASLSKAVLKHTADLGVIFDADCDRAGLVDQAGRAINRNRLIALVSAMLLNEKPGLTIVTDSVTSSGLSKFIGEWGGEHYRYKRGYRNVIDEAKLLNEAGIDCPLAIETSGHAALRENDFLDDGMYLATLLICEAMRLKREGKILSSLLEGLQEPVESAELRLSIAGDDYRATGLKLIETIMDYATDEENGWQIAPDNREGIRISFDLDQGMDNAWFLLRLSVHDPVLALNIESDVPGGVKRILKKLLELVQDSPNVDFEPIRNYIKQE